MKLEKKKLKTKKKIDRKCFDMNKTKTFRLEFLERAEI
jgi:hypothetical protein